MLTGLSEWQMERSFRHKVINKVRFHVYTAWRGLYRNRLRSLLSCLGIIFGVAAFVSMLAVAEGASSNIVEGIKELGLRNIVIKSVDFRQGLSEQTQELVKGLDIFSKFSSVKLIRGNVVDSRTDVKVVAVSPSFKEIFRTSMAFGRFIHDCDVKNGVSVAVAGAEAARSLGLRYRTEGLLTIEKQAYRLVGILAPRAWAVKKKGAILSWDINRCIFVPYDPRFYGRPQTMIVQVADGNDVIKAAKVLARMMQIKGINARIIVPLALRNQALKSKRIFDIVLGSIAAISLVVGGIGIANVMLASVTERTTEIGIRCTFGASQNDILFQFLSEALIMGIFGAIAGIFLGSYIALLIQRFFSIPINFNFKILVIAICLGVIVSVSACYYPARKASNIDPLHAIKFNTW